MLINQELYIEVVDRILQTEVLTSMEAQNPAIKYTCKQLYSFLETFRDQLSNEVLEEITDYIGDYVSATADFAVLYGIQIGVVLNEIIANPSAYSQYMLENFMQGDNKA